MLHILKFIEDLTGDSLFHSSMTHRIDSLQKLAQLIVEAHSVATGDTSTLGKVVTIAEKTGLTIKDMREITNPVPVGAITEPQPLAESVEPDAIVEDVDVIADEEESKATPSGRGKSRKGK